MVLGGSDEMKKTLKIIWILFVIILLTACGKSQEQMVSEQLELGMKFLTEENYEQAMLTFQKVIDLEPKTWEAYKGMATILERQKDYEQAASNMEQGIAQVGSENISTEDIDMLVKIYKNWLDEATEKGDLDLVLIIYDKILTFRPDEVEIREKKEEKKAVSLYQEQLKTMAETIAQEENYNFSDSLILSDEFQNLIKNLKEPIIFTTESGSYIGIYPGGYIYNGEMLEGVRQGNGRWYYGDISRITIMEGTWSHDAPNGMATITEVINLDEIKRTDKIERGEGHTYTNYTKTICNLSNGIYEGTGEIIWGMETGTVHEWYVTYKKGILQLLDENGVSYCRNCNAILRWTDNVFHIEGIE